MSYNFQSRKQILTLRGVYEYENSSALKNIINGLVKVWAYFREAKKVALYFSLDLRVQAIVMTVVRLGALTNFLRRETKGSNLKPIVTIEFSV